MDTDITFLQFLTSKPLIFILVILFQLFLLFRAPLKTILTAWSRRVARRLTIRKEFEGDTERSHGNKSNHVIFPENVGVAKKAVSVFDVSLSSLHSKEITVNIDSEVRSRFAIFYLKDYKEITLLMASLVTLGIELLSTTVIFKSERKEVIIFYVSYYGYKLEMQDN